MSNIVPVPLVLTSKLEDAALQHLDAVLQACFAPRPLLLAEIDDFASAFDPKHRTTAVPAADALADALLRVQATLAAGDAAPPADPQLARASDAVLDVVQAMDAVLPFPSRRRPME